MMSAKALSGHELLKGAKEFHFTAVLCRSKMVIEDPAQWLVQPQMVNNAFASELALKGLQAIHLGVASKGHDLVLLLEPLPTAVIERIRGPLYPQSEFEKGLKGSRLAFETWRYAHEHHQLSAHLSFLEKFAASVIAVLEQDVQASGHNPGA